MAKRPSSSQSPEPVKTQLLVPREEAKHTIEGLIQEGENILVKLVGNQIDYDMKKKEFSSWSEFVKEYLIQIFNTNKEANEFAYRGAFMVSMHSTLSDDIENLNEIIDTRVRRLQSICRKLEIIPVTISDHPVPNIQEPIRPRSVPSFTINNYGVISGSQIQQGSDASPLTQYHQEAFNFMSQLQRDIENIIPYLSEDEKLGVQQDFNNLNIELGKVEPRKPWCQISADGLIKAAQNIGRIGEPVIATVSKIIALIGLSKGMIQ